MYSILQFSTCGAMYAVRKVTTDNTGKRTAGIDFKKAKTPKNKLKLVENVLDTIHKEWRKYKHK
ncbi:MAG: reverse transcriptase N-terminal domain-containing protein [Pseudomonadota bacterium]